jgi:hypothetical protein
MRFFLENIDFKGFYTANLARPLALRRAITFFPAFVDCLTRKPHDFARFIFFGLYVNDINYFLTSYKQIINIKTVF